MPEGRERIAVLYASVGGGHGRAAEAVARALKELRPSARVETADLLDFTNRAFRHLYGKAYFDIYARAPHLIGYLYDRLARPTSEDSVSVRLRRLVQGANLRRFNAFLLAEPWDAVVNTHFLLAEIVAAHRRGGADGRPSGHGGDGF